MDKLKIKGTENTPDINFDISTGEFWIEGNSFFNNSGEFFIDIIKWVNSQKVKPATKIKLHVSLEYFDSSSKKGVVELIKTLIEWCKKTQLEIFWHYNTDDQDALDIGKEFSKFFEMDFNFISSIG